MSEEPSTHRNSMMTSTSIQRWSPQQSRRSHRLAGVARAGPRATVTRLHGIREPDVSLQKRSPEGWPHRVDYERPDAKISARLGCSEAMHQGAETSVGCRFEGPCPNVGGLAVTHGDSCTALENPTVDWLRVHHPPATGHRVHPSRPSAVGRCTCQFMSGCPHGAEGSAQRGAAAGGPPDPRPPSGPTRVARRRANRWPERASSTAPLLPPLRCGPPCRWFGRKPRPPPSGCVGPAQSGGHARDGGTG